ncbi:MAG: hypothetical protein M3Y13_09120, partial [Armatimonadota bacterium]|nr:hypothetical protein [Armatimonadota bacterium]
ARPRPSNGAELVARLQEEGILGMWADREDMGDSGEFARKLRRQAETRPADSRRTEASGLLYPSLRGKGGASTDATG